MACSLSAKGNYRRACDWCQNPNQVCLLQVETIPRPSQPQLKAACDAIDFLTPTTRGLTLGYGIFIRSDCGGTDLSLSTSSTLASTRGLVEFSFLRRYLFECLTVGYSAAFGTRAIAVTAASALSNSISFPES